MSLSNMKRLSEKELIKRAKELYFDHNPAITKIAVDEFGRFAYPERVNVLLEQNRHNDGKVFIIDKNGIAETDGKEDKKAAKDTEALKKKIGAAKMALGKAQKKADENPDDEKAAEALVKAEEKLQNAEADLAELE